MAIANGQIGPVSISNLTKEELAVFWGGKLLWLSYFVVLPAARSHHSWSSLAFLWMLSEAVAGWILALMFQVTSESPLLCCAVASLLKRWLTNAKNAKCIVITRNLLTGIRPRPVQADKADPVVQVWLF